MAEVIKVTIGPDGDVSYIVQGVKGRSCKDLTKAIDALGQVTESKNTSEYNEAPTNNNIRTNS